MRTDDELWWLDLPEIIGFEDEDDGDDGDDDADDSDDDDESSDDSDDDSSDDDDDSDEDDDEEKPDVKGLKSALAKERAERRRLAKEVKELKKNQKPPAKKKTKAADDDEDDDDSSKPDEEAQRRNEKLAGKLLTNAINTEIIKAAGSKFKDIDDVLALINRDEIDAEQDDDDPSDVEVDSESVRDAIKQLAKKKPHLVASTNGEGTKSGSKFGGRKKGGANMTEEQLKEKYAALRDR